MAAAAVSVFFFVYCSITAAIPIGRRIYNDTAANQLFEQTIGIVIPSHRLFWSYFEEQQRHRIRHRRQLQIADEPITSQCHVQIIWISLSSDFDRPYYWDGRCTDHSCSSSAKQCYTINGTLVVHRRRDASSTEQEGEEEEEEVVQVPVTRSCECRFPWIHH